MIKAIDYPKGTLFEVCALCDGTGVVPAELNAMGECVCHGTGFSSSGLTLSQFNLYKDRAEEAQFKLIDRNICPGCNGEDVLVLHAGGRNEEQVWAVCSACGWSGMRA